MKPFLAPWHTHRLGFLDDLTKPQLEAHGIQSWKDVFDATNLKATNLKDLSGMEQVSMYLQSKLFCVNQVNLLA